MAQRILGLDVGATAVRAVLVESAYRGWSVVEAIRADVAPELAGEASLRDRQLAAVRALLEAHPLTFDTAMVALPGICASHAIELPFTDARRIEQTIGFEVEGQIPFDLDEVAWDWQPLRAVGDQTELLVAVVRKEELAALLAGLAAAGVDPRAVVPPAPALAALFGEGIVAGEGAPGAEAGAEAVVDLDGGRASVCVVTAGGCEVARTFPVVGPAVAPIARDVRATLRAWRARFGSAAPPIRRLLLAREAAFLPGLGEALAHEVAGPVEPLAIAGPPLAGLAAEDAPAYTLALAMALRGHQGSRAPRLNLRRGELAYTRDFQHVRGRVVKLALWSAAVLALAIVSSTVKVMTLSHQERLLDGALCEATQKLVGKCFENDELAVAALRGKGTVTASIPKSSALDLFTELSNRSPTDVPLKYDRIEITREKLHLQGVAEAAEQVDRIVSGLHGSRCFGTAASGYVRKRTSDGKFEFAIDSDITCDTGEKPAGRT